MASSGRRAAYSFLDMMLVFSFCARGLRGGGRNIGRGPRKSGAQAGPARSADSLRHFDEDVFAVRESDDSVVSGHCRFGGS